MTFPGQRPLPRGLLPLPGESLPGLVIRLAHRLETTPGEVASKTGLHQGPSPSKATPNFNRLLMLEATQLSIVAAALRLPEPALDALTFRPLADRYPPVTEALTRRGQAGQLRPRGFFPPWILATHTRYCPSCLAGDGSEIQRRHGGPWKILWRLPVVFACVQHNVFLRHTCPGCSRPAQDSRSRDGTRLIAAAATAGLHPAQCRNRDSERSAAPPCGYRLDSPQDDGDSPAPSPSLIALQQRILGLLDPSSDNDHAAGAFKDLHTVATIVIASWPGAATMTPEPRLAEALDHEIDQQRRCDPGSRTAAQQRRLWTTPPLTALATAALMDISSRLLALPQAAFGQAVDALLRNAPPPSALGWGRTWTMIRTSEVPAFTKEVRASLPPPFVPTARVGKPTWQRARQPIAAVRDRGYLPEHVPQWLPDDWFTVMVTHSGGTALARSAVFRRFAAVQLVQIATGMQMDGAAEFLGIPDEWHLSDVHKRKLHPLHRYQHRPEDLVPAFEGLGQHISDLRPPVDYRARRRRFADWAMDPAAWGVIQAGLPRPHRNRWTIPEHEVEGLLQECASEFIWSQLTGSEMSLAPTSRDLGPSASEPDQASPKGLIRHRLLWPRGFPYYLELRSALTNHAHTLATSNDE
ncbi:TniQ family protein [Streptomyces sp. NPDC055796]